MADHSAALPTDIDVLHALVTSVLAERDAAIAERDELAARNAKLEHLIREIRRAHFGRKSERIDDDHGRMQLFASHADLALGGPGAVGCAFRNCRARSATALIFFSSAAIWFCQFVARLPPNKRPPHSEEPKDRFSDHYRRFGRRS
jgi:hypothetical protein